jgi:hypothetical protein
MKNLKYYGHHSIPPQEVPFILLSVLYVDDEPSLLEIASIYLAETYPDIVCETAISAHIALDLVREKHSTLSSLITRCQVWTGSPS